MALGAIIGGLGAAASIFGASKQASEAKKARQLAAQAEKRQRQLFETASPYYNPILQYFSQRAGINMPDMRAQQRNQAIYDAVMKAKPKNREKTYQNILKQQAIEDEWRQRLGMGDAPAGGRYPTSYGVGDGYEDEYGMGDGYYDAMYGEGDAPMGRRSGFGLRRPRAQAQVSPVMQGILARLNTPGYQPQQQMGEDPARQAFIASMTPQQQAMYGGGGMFSQSSQITPEQRAARQARMAAMTPEQQAERQEMMRQMFGGFNPGSFGTPANLTAQQKLAVRSQLSGFGRGGGSLFGQGDGYDYDDYYGMGDDFSDPDDLEYYEALYGQGDMIDRVTGRRKAGFGVKPKAPKPAPVASTQVVPPVASTQPVAAPVPSMAGGTVSDADLGIFNQRPQALQFQAADEDLRRQLNRTLGNINANLGRRGLANSSLAAGMQERLGSAYLRDLGQFRRQLALDAPREQDRLMMQLMSGLGPGFGAGESAAGMAANQAALQQQLAGQAWGGVGQSLGNLAYLDAMWGKGAKK